MEFISYLWGFIIHIDVHLAEITSQYGPLAYGILFVIIFCETGLVVTPFLPGDSLLFAAGAITAISDAMDIHLLFLLLFVAAVLGDAVNYHVGAYFGEKAFSPDHFASRFFKKKYLEKTEAFYKKYGGKTIIIARFVPIVRTFAPFLAGVGIMSYRKFFAYNIIGAFLWTSIFLYAGFYFGNEEYIKKNFSLVILAIIIISIMPIIIEFIKAKYGKTDTPKEV